MARYFGTHRRGIGFPSGETYGNVPGATAIISAAPNEEVLVLVLSRKQGQRLCVGDDIVITVTQIRKGRVLIGVDAPPEIAILREESSQSPQGRLTAPRTVGIAIAPYERVRREAPAI
jgi:carbon storage regulator CsrA